MSIFKTHGTLNQADAAYRDKKYSRIHYINETQRKHCILKMLIIFAIKPKSECDPQKKSSKVIARDFFMSVKNFRGDL